MRRLGVLIALVVWPAAASAAGFPFKPPAGFTQVLRNPFSFTVSPFVANMKTHEYVVAQAFPTVTTQAQLVSALRAAKQQLPQLPRGGPLDEQVTICGATGLHGRLEHQDEKRRWAVEEWSFISSGTGYEIDYVRPASVPANPVVEKKLQKFCPGDENQMQALGLPNFEILGPPRKYDLLSTWEAQTIGGAGHGLVYLSGTNLESDPSMSLQYLVHNGFTKKLATTVSHCGSQLDKEILTYGGAEGFTLEREFGTSLNRTYVLSYLRDSGLPASPAAENSLKTFCVPQPPRVDFSGSWGGAGAALVIQGNSAALTANCFSGAMLTAGPNLNSPDGRTFELSGTMIAGSREREVRYLGTVAKRRMQLKITSLAGRQLARFDLKYGSHGDVHSCH